MKKREIGSLREAEKQTLASFTIVQLRRGPGVRAQFAHIARIAREHLEGVDPGSADRLGIHLPSPEEVKESALRALQGAPELVPHLLSKDWLLFEAPAGAEFVVGDCPVVMANNLAQSDVRGTVGLAVRGVEIYFPIHPSVCLAFYCPSVTQLLILAYAEALDDFRRGKIEQTAMDYVGGMADGVRCGVGIQSNLQNVLYANALQVTRSERFIFGRDPDYSFALEIIDKQPEARTGIRPKIQK